MSLHNTISSQSYVATAALPPLLPSVLKYPSLEIRTVSDNQYLVLEAPSLQDKLDLIMGFLYIINTASRILETTSAVACWTREK